MSNSSSSSSSSVFDLHGPIAYVFVNALHVASELALAIVPAYLVIRGLVALGWL